MLIAVTDLCVQLGQRQVLRNITTQVERGDIITVIGPNGSGKSTLLKSLIGAVPVSSGQITKQANIKIGYVPQILHFDEALPITVERFMRLNRRFDRNDIREALTQAGVSHLSHQQLMSLSGGQFQRVLLARALLGQPDLLLLDEATQGLDHKGAMRFYRQIDFVRRELNCAIIMVSHDLNVVMRRTDHVICLNGEICCQGKPESVSKAPEYHALFGLDEDSDAALYIHKEHQHSNRTRFHTNNLSLKDPFHA